MRRSGIRGVLTGALALVALHTLVSSGASGRVAKLFELPGRWAVRFLAPGVPAIPDRSNGDGGGGQVGQGIRRRGGATQPQRRYPDPFLPPFATPGPGGD